MNSKPFTKIVATIGPSTWDDKVLLQMIADGFVVARINASFADTAELDRVSQQLRRLSPRVAVMLDTKGHKIRVTGFEEDIKLLTGEKLTLLPESARNRKGAVKITYETLHKDVVRGTTILFDDGNIQLTVEDIKDDAVICEIVHGGILKTRKTVNIPNVHLNFPDLSEKDKEDIKFAVDNNFDLISASYVRNVDEIKLIRKIMGDSDTKLIAKIEDHEGVKNFDEILEVVDGIMVARGDLGVELPAEQVPILQKQFIRKCRMKGKPVIVATQMLESMRNNTRPTRAEVSDVANAVADGADALMLSAETSTGNNPVEAVQTMGNIAREIEKHLAPQIIEGRTAASEATDVICKHLFSMVNELNLKGVIILSRSGLTAASLARHRLSVPIWSISANPKLIRQQQLLRGVTGYVVTDFKRERDAAIQQAVDIVYSKGLLELNDRVAVISGSSIYNKSTNSILEIVEVKNVLLL